MTDETTISQKPEVATVLSKTETTTQGPAPVDSQLANISVRAWIAILIALTICIMSIWGKEVIEPLYGLGYMAIGFFFGQKSPKTP